MALAQKLIHRTLEQNRLPQVNSHLHGQLTYDKVGKTIQ